LTRRVGVVTIDNAGGSSPEVRGRVLARVDDGETVRLACDLIRIPSFTTEETACAEWLANYLADQGSRWSCRRSSPDASRPSPGSAEPAAADAIASMMRAIDALYAMRFTHTHDPDLPGGYTDYHDVHTYLEDLSVCARVLALTALEAAA
jgi:hypothetical protein